MNGQRFGHWLTFATLMFAAGLGLDGVWIRAWAALAQLRLRWARARTDHPAHGGNRGGQVVCRHAIDSMDGSWMVACHAIGALAPG
ncbi:MAG: hypothetical protein EPN69_04735 [Rhodanobacter sp.]|nr:MAG: hypothetical protein EPN69_04735 [Rhodanobacter sp.]TAM04346.1 MAG: hypothetical protein EPN71_02845 [Rhodanobacter sp.]TAM39478.1 MAG: hypothetical protein EPN58_13415 [Rhodanobacter sp.]TAN29050.1 MAG: hypothetical protein EPN32_01485 [Rhodanobacter sp.]